MKKVFQTILFVVFATIAIAQIPQGINYQAVIRDNNGNLLQNQSVGIKINIHQSSASGSVVYAETFTQMTNQFGLVNLVIGQGNVASGSFSNISWGTSTFFAELLIDISGGSSYSSMGTQQLLSVPYSLYSEKAGHALIADSVVGGSGSGGGSQNGSVTVLYNSVSPTSASINHAILSVFGTGVQAMTANNYWYTFRNGTNTVQSFANTAILATDTNSSNPTFYVYAYPICGSGVVSNSNVGQVFGITTNHTTGVYYVPLNATATSTPPQLYQYNCSTGHWTVFNASLLPSYQYLQLQPNNNSVTGFNLNFPVSVTITR